MITEEYLLEKLSSGQLDGKIGKDFKTGRYKKVTYSYWVKDGIPYEIRESPGFRSFDNEESKWIDGKRIKTEYRTDSEKIAFIQKLGWKFDDQEIKDYYYQSKKSSNLC